MKKKKGGIGFTLIEVMVGILIFSIIIIGGFKAYTGVLVGKVKLIESTDIQKQAFYFSEKFFEEIKVGGTIDYEEYFNRTVVGTSTLSGHYDTQTGFGNYGRNGNIGTLTIDGEGFYFCRSGNGIVNEMTGTGCVSHLNDTGHNYVGLPQRYGQYAFQFIDYNSNYDADLGDEDGDPNSNIRGDDDDEYLGEGPYAFTGAEVKEVYLISADKKRRTLFRWHIRDDSDHPSPVCDVNTGIGDCQSTIEFLKLKGKDWGLNHTIGGGGDPDSDGSQYDGIVDTWMVDQDFSGGVDVIASSGGIDAYWQPLFGDNINVSNVGFFAFPNKDIDLAWKDSSNEINIAPYLRIQMTLSPSYKARKGIKGKIPEVHINTTISLTDIYSR